MWSDGEILNSRHYDLDASINAGASGKKKV